MLAWEYRRLVAVRHLANDASQVADDRQQRIIGITAGRGLENIPCLRLALADTRRGGYHGGHPPIRGLP